MPALPRGQIALAFSLVVFAGCTDLARRVDGSLGVVELIETAPPIEVVPTPVVPSPVGPSSQVILSEPIFAMAAPPPARHRVTITPQPVGARSLDQIQSLEVDVEVTGGVLGSREISAVFISPQGLVWERQLTLLDAQGAAAMNAHFSLPVASTFIEEQQLSGRWQIDTLDDGAPVGTGEVQLEGVAP